MIAFLNQNDLDNLKLGIDKMKSIDFDAARKMELLVEAYEKQGGGDSELERLREAVEDLPGYSSSADHVGHVKDTADMLGRASERVLEWADSKDDEPLDEAVKRLVELVDSRESKHAEQVDELTETLNEIVHVVDRGGSDALIAIRNLAATAL